MSTSSTVKAQLSTLLTSANSATGVSDTNLTDAVTSLISGYNAGGSSEPDSKDIDFYDYDGTRLYSYTIAEAQALAALPELPTHEGLVNNGWNFTLAEVKAVTDFADVGCTYSTSDGATRAYIHVSSEDSRTVSFCFKQSAERGVAVNWGDGSADETFENMSSAGSVIVSHTYSTCGDFTVSFKPASGVTLTLGLKDRLTDDILEFHFSNYIRLGDNNIYCHYANIYKLEIGNNAALERDSFCGCHGLETVTVPNTVTSIPSKCFYYCDSLRAFVFPRSVTTVDDYNLYQCAAVKMVSIPSTLRQSGTYFCSNIAVERIRMGDSITNIKSYSSINLTVLKHAHVSQSATALAISFMLGNGLLKNIRFPASVSSTGAHLCGECTSIGDAYFDSHTAVPSVNAGPFEKCGERLLIHIPVALYDEWRTATNWVAVAQKMVPCKNGADVTLSGITVTTQPATTNYSAGASFDKMGMVVTATYSDGSSYPVNDYTVTPEPLAAGTTAVTVSYTVRENTATVSVPVTVS